MSPLSTPVADTTGLAAEVERLRTLLERQPSCLMRVAVDGTLLAVNEAALSLLGASELGQVLDSSLVECIEDGRTTWSGFIQRVAQRMGLGKNNPLAPPIVYSDQSSIGRLVSTVISLHMTSPGNTKERQYKASDNYLESLIPKKSNHWLHK